MIRLLLVVFTLFLLSCSEGSMVSLPTKGASPGVYYWKTNLELKEADIELAQKTGFSQLFVRTGDLDWNYNNDKVNPKGIIKIDPGSDLKGLPVTPVLYLVNRVLREHKNADKLGGEIGKFLADFESNHTSLSFSGRWQIDCDWTPGTRDAYFSLLRRIKADYPEVTLSVTVRLHQYRERQDNGIPPADEGLLMCYNMAPVDDISTSNSIFSPPLLTGYLKAATYPLPLDAALPIFEWGAAFRNNKFIGIVDTPDSFPGDLVSVGPGRYLVSTETTSKGKLLRPGDDLRYDGPVNAVTLLRAAELLRSKEDIRDIHIFDWNPDNWEKFDVNSWITPE